MAPPSGPDQLTPAGKSCMVVLGILVLGIFALCSGVMGNAKPQTNEEIMIEHDQNVQAQQQWDREESVHKDLLNRGYSPEEVEKTLSHESGGK